MVDGGRWRACMIEMKGPCVGRCAEKRGRCATRWLQRGDCRGSTTRPCVEAENYVGEEGGGGDGLAGLSLAVFASRTISLTT
jgi:hypothetical protein